MQKARQTAVLVALTSALHAGGATDASAEEGVIFDSQKAESLGINFDLVLGAFEEVGIDAPTEGIYLMKVYDEDNVVDLQTFEGQAVRVSIDSIVSGDSDIPRNVHA